MKIKNIVLSLTLISIACNPVLVAVGNKTADVATIKEAEATKKKLSAAVKCVLRKKGCSPKQRRKIIGYGLALVGLVAIIAAGGGTFLLLKPISPQKAKEKYEKTQDYLFGLFGAQKISTEIREWRDQLDGTNQVEDIRVKITRGMSLFPEQKEIMSISDNLDAYDKNLAEARAVRASAESAGKVAQANAAYVSAHRLLEKAQGSIIEANKKYLNIKKVGKEEEE